VLGRPLGLGVLGGGLNFSKVFWAVSVPLIQKVVGVSVFRPLLRF
jgi:hypothetical protein